MRLFTECNNCCNRPKIAHALDQGHTRGSSLLELVVYIAILGIMFVCIIRVRNQVDKANIASVVETARNINNIASKVYATTGAWPADQNNSICPPEMISHLKTNLFPNDTPLGGRWDWNGPNSSVGNLTGISLRFKPTTSANSTILLEIDRMIDDGNLSSGNCQTILNGGSLFYVFSVAVN
jgi:type II secretory pathway pseudopilin PulG